MLLKSENMSNDKNNGKVLTNHSNNSTINSFRVLTGMSHEMRTHMNSIMAFSFLMRENQYNDDQNLEFSEHIFYSCEQLVGLFEDFIDSTIIDLVNLKVESKLCKLNDILDDLLAEFRKVLKKDIYNGITLRTENHSPDFPEVYIDSSKVLRVIRCLFRNALKNTSIGYIKIGYYYKDEKITFYVSDSGQSYSKCKEFLDTNDLDESLTKFSDTDLAINLTLVKKIILSIDGNFWIERNDIAGSMIFFSVPVQRAALKTISSNKSTNVEIISQ